MASFSKLNGFVENLANKEIDLGSASITVALSNTAPGDESTPPTGTAAECILGNVTEVSYTNCSTRVVTVTSVTQTAGTVKAIYADLTLTASGAVGPFRYIYIYDDGSTGNVADVVFTTDEKVEFQTWNSNIQTSMINFNRVCGIQMKTVNVPSPIIDSYKDDFYNGNFYNGVFYGKWHDGKWGNGEFKGWNSATTITTSGSSQHLQSPIAINITNALNVTQFYENYNHLKKKDLYYDIAPWDDANKKKSEIISIKLPNKYRS